MLDLPDVTPSRHPALEPVTFKHTSSGLLRLATLQVMHNMHLQHVLPHSMWCTELLGNGACHPAIVHTGTCSMACPMDPWPAMVWHNNTLLLTPSHAQKTLFTAAFLVALPKAHHPLHPCSGQVVQPPLQTTHCPRNLLRMTCCCHCCCCWDCCNHCN